MNRHGNNFHPSLPPCPACGGAEWVGNDVYIGHGTQSFYSCAKAECDGRSMVLFRGLGFLVQFKAPLVDGAYEVPPAAMRWASGGAKAVGAADVNECVHGGKEPPTSIVAPPAAPLVDATCYVCGDGEWSMVDPMAEYDLSHLFRQRVIACRKPPEVQQ